MILTTTVRNMLKASLALLSLSAVGALPQSVDGQDIPSLAPMVENATPAVVNIATQGHVELRSNPLFNDPFQRVGFWSVVGLGVRLLRGWRGVGVRERKGRAVLYDV